LDDVVWAGKEEECEFERGGRDAEDDAIRAGRELAFAEEFLGRFGGELSGDDGFRRGDGVAGEDLLAYEGPGLGGKRIMDGDLGDVKIGGIPSKFLDLSHFPLLRRSFPRRRGGEHRRDREAFCSPEQEKDEMGDDGMDGGNEGRRRRPIIDCTEEDDYGGDVPRELAVPDYENRLYGASSTSMITMMMPRDDVVEKRDVKRAYVSNASLAHVNGTYIRCGTYNNAPLFVRTGGPRKFMGRDCAVVLRREERREISSNTIEEEKRRLRIGIGAIGGEGENDNDDVGRMGPRGYEWKIGLVPANCVCHSGIICYFLAKEENRHWSTSPPSNDAMDRMDDDDLDDEEDETYYDPPADGWRVFQEARTANKASTFVSSSRANYLGRASSLKISYV
jgi:hypothetical protein